MSKLGSKVETIIAEVKESNRSLKELRDLVKKYDLVFHPNSSARRPTRPIKAFQ